MIYLDSTIGIKKQSYWGEHIPIDIEKIIICLPTMSIRCLGAYLVWREITFHQMTKEQQINTWVNTKQACEKEFNTSVRQSIKTRLIYINYRDIKELFTAEWIDPDIIKRLMPIRNL